MKIRITKTTVTRRVFNVCGWSGNFETEVVTLEVGMILEPTNCERGPKTKDGRVSTLYFDSGTRQPDHLTIPESHYEVIEA